MRIRCGPVTTTHARVAKPAKLRGVEHDQLDGGRETQGAPPRNNRNNEDGRRGRGAFVTRQIRTEIISDQRHTSLRRWQRPLFVSLSLRLSDRRRRDAMKWDGVGAMHERASFMRLHRRLAKSQLNK